MKENVFDVSYISAFCMEMYLIVRTGIPFSEGVALLRDDEPDMRRRNILDQLHQQLGLGESIAVAMREAKVFPVYVVELTEIGQKTGHLEQTFRALAEYYERVEQLQKSIRNAITYPAVLLCMMLIVVFVLLVKVMPIFQAVFAQLGAELSPSAKVLMQIGQGLGQYGFLFLLAVFVIILVALWYLRDTKRRLVAYQRLQSSSENWEISRLVASSRLADVLVLTFSSGMNIEDSLDLAMRLMPGATMKEKIIRCKREMLLENKTFAEAALNSQLLNPLYCRMLAVGFRSGSVDCVLAEIARRCAEQVDDTIECMLNRVEPTLVIIMSLLVGLILLSVMLPLMSIMTAVG